MKKTGRAKKQVEVVYNSEDDSNDEEMGKAAVPMNYIDLKTKGNYKLKPDEQSSLTVELFRNDELLKYIQQVEERQKTNKKGKSKHENVRKQLMKDIYLHLQLNKNICLYGGLDKMEIMKSVTDYLKQHNQFILVIKGFIQPLNEKKIYNQFGSYLIKIGLTKKIDQVLIKEQLKEYRKLLETTQQNFRIYVVFYQLSNFAFLDSESQQRLGELFSLPRIHLIASVESAKIVRTWSLTTQQLFKFCYISANGTSFPMLTLLKHQPLPNQKSQKTQNQIIQIWKSLNKNQRQIAVILAKNEINNIKNDQQNYLSFSELLDCCVDQIILSDDHQLRENLVQLIDHRVVLEQIDKTKNKRTFIMKLERRILENMIEGKYDDFEIERN